MQQLLLTNIRIPIRVCNGWNFDIENSKSVRFKGVRLCTRRGSMWPRSRAMESDVFSMCLIVIFSFFFVERRNFGSIRKLIDQFQRYSVSEPTPQPTKMSWGYEKNNGTVFQPDPHILPHPNAHSHL